MTIAIDELVGRCQEALAEHTPSLAVRDVLNEVIRRPADLEAAVPVEQGGIKTLHRSDELTVLRIAWTPGMQLNPHEHAMWAVVALYGGQEDNAFYRRSAEGLVPSGGRQLHDGEVLVMGKDAIHAVSNTRREYAVALHVYGGDFFSDQIPRSEWDPQTFEERPRDVAGTMRLFEAANAAWAAESAGS